MDAVWSLATERVDVSTIVVLEERSVVVGARCRDTVDPLEDAVPAPDATERVVADSPVSTVVGDVVVDVDVLDMATSPVSPREDTGSWTGRVTASVPVGVPESTDRVRIVCVDGAGGGGGVTTFHENERIVVSDPSFTETVTEYDPSVVTVPVMKPVVREICRPGGNPVAA